jgi:uncharacterized protein
MNERFKRRSRKTVLSIVAIYVFSGIAFYFIQDKILFHPTPLSREHKFSFEQPFEELNIAFENENLSIVKFRPYNNRKGIILFYHGNVENVEHYKKYPPIFLRNDCEVWMIDYPGFGKTTGKLTEKIIDKQALLMYDMASNQVRGGSIIIYGKSIGTGVASYVAANRACEQLIFRNSLLRYRFSCKTLFPDLSCNSTHQIFFSGS